MSELNHRQYAQDFLDRYTPTVMTSKALRVDKQGETHINTDIPNAVKRHEKGDPIDDYVLMIAPTDCVRIEFELKEHGDMIKAVEKTIRNIIAAGYQYSVTYHKGGRSKYINIFNLSGMPLSGDENFAKKLIWMNIVPEEYQGADGVDKSNFGYSWTPIPGLPHWKSKYEGAIHAFEEGTPEITQKNKYPKAYISDIKKHQKAFNNVIKHTREQASWVEDFLLGYCLENKLPEGNRHWTIEKNLAAFIVHRKDAYNIKQQWANLQRGGNMSPINSWETAIIRQGKYTEICPGELRNYILVNDINFDIPAEWVVEYENNSPEKDEFPPTFDLTEKHIAKLKDPLLVAKLIKEIQNDGICGNIGSILALIFRINMRNVCDAIATSHNIAITAKTGAGKDALAKHTIAVLVPEYYKKHRTSLTPMVLKYWNSDLLSKDGWDRFVLYVEDPSEDFMNCDITKVFMSGPGTMTVVDEQEARDITIVGQPVVLFTFYKQSINTEDQRRLDSVTCDDSEGTTVNTFRAVANRKKISAKKPPIDEELRYAIQSLKRRCVVHDFDTELLIEALDATVLKNRTKISTVMDLIYSSAVLHQYQRDEDADGNIIASYEDIVWALIVHKLCSGFGDSAISKDMFEVLEALGQDKDNPKTYQEISEAARKDEKWLRNHLGELIELELIAPCTKNVKVNGFDRQVKAFYRVPKPVGVDREIILTDVASFQAVLKPLFNKIELNDILVLLKGVACDINNIPSERKNISKAITTFLGNLEFLNIHLAKQIFTFSYCPSHTSRIQECKNEGQIPPVDPILGQFSRASRLLPNDTQKGEKKEITPRTMTDTIMPTNNTNHQRKKNNKGKKKEQMSQINQERRPHSTVSDNECKDDEPTPHDLMSLLPDEYPRLIRLGWAKEELDKRIHEGTLSKGPNGYVQKRKV